MDQYWTEFLLVFGTNFINVLTPGLGVAIVMRNTVCYSRAMGIMTVVGMTLSTIIHKTYILLGRHYLESLSFDFFRIVKWIGCAYIFFLAYKCFTKQSQHQEEFAPLSTSNAMPHQTLWQGLRQGFWTDLINPQASFVFFSIASTTISHSTPLSIQGLYAVAMVASCFLWHAFLVLCVTIPQIERFTRRGRWLADRLTGVFLTSIGVRVLLAGL